MSLGKPPVKPPRIVVLAGMLVMASIFIPWVMIIGESSYYREGIGLVEETFMVLEFPLAAYAHYTMNGEVMQGWITLFPLRSIAAIMALVSGLMVMREARRREVDAKMLTIAIALGLAAPTVFTAIDNVDVSLPQASDLSQSYSIIPLGVILPIAASSLSLYHMVKKLSRVEAAALAQVPGVYVPRKCPICQHPIMGEYVYCPNCGSKLRPEIR